MHHGVLHFCSVIEWGHGLLHGLVRKKLGYNCFDSFTPDNHWMGILDD